MKPTKPNGSERTMLSSLEFGKGWMTDSRLCHVVGANLIFSLDITGTEEFLVTESS